MPTINGRLYPYAGDYDQHDIINLYSPMRPSHTFTLQDDSGTAISCVSISAQHIPERMDVLAAYLTQLLQEVALKGHDLKNGCQIIHNHSTLT